MNQLFPLNVLFVTRKSQWKFANSESVHGTATSMKLRFFELLIKASFLFFQSYSAQQKPFFSTTFFLHVCIDFLCFCSKNSMYFIFCSAALQTSKKFLFNFLQVFSSRSHRKMEQKCAKAFSIQIVNVSQNYQNFSDWSNYLVSLTCFFIFSKSFLIF